MQFSSPSFVTKQLIVHICFTYDFWVGADTFEKLIIDNFFSAVTVSIIKIFIMGII